MSTDALHSWLVQEIGMSAVDDRAAIPVTSLPISCTKPKRTQNQKPKYFIPGTARPHKLSFSMYALWQTPFSWPMPNILFCFCSRFQHTNRTDQCWCCNKSHLLRWGQFSRWKRHWDLLARRQTLVHGWCVENKSQRTSRNILRISLGRTLMLALPP